MISTYFLWTSSIKMKKMTVRKIDDRSAGGGLLSDPRGVRAKDADQKMSTCLLIM